VVPYSPLRLPQTFQASSEQTLGPLVVERLQRILPETGPGEAILYLDDASLAFFLCRSYQGIVASSFKDLVPLFDEVLLSPISDDKTDMLKGILKAEMEAPPRGLGINVKAQRVKGIFNLLNAATIR
jgi:hypothetical protein